MKRDRFHLCVFSGDAVDANSRDIATGGAVAVYRAIRVARRSGQTEWTCGTVTVVLVADRIQTFRTFATVATGTLVITRLASVKVFG